MNWAKKMLPLAFIVMVFVSSIVSYGAGKPDISRHQKRGRIEMKSSKEKTKTLRYRRKVVRIVNQQTIRGELKEQRMA